FSTTPRPPTSPLFPYTTLFRSHPRWLARRPKRLVRAQPVDLRRQPSGLGPDRQRPAPLLSLSSGETSMSMAVDELAGRIRPLMPTDSHIEEKRMFGGMAIMLNGNMVVCPTRDGSLIVRVGKDGVADALAAGANPMEMGGRVMSGFVVVSGDAIEDDAVLAHWIGRALAFVSTLPAK